MVPRISPAISHDEHDAFATLVRQAFSQRRKTLRNSLKGLVSEADIIRLDIDPGLRPEQITLNQYARLANSITK